MTIGKDLRLAKKKLDYLRMKMCKGVCLSRVKVKGLAHIRQLRESTIPTDLSSKHKVCFMMKFAFKVMDMCLWYLDSGCSRHMTGDQSLFKVFESRKGGNVTFGDGSKSQIKGKRIISLPILPDIANVLYVEGLRVNLRSISQICELSTKFDKANQTIRALRFENNFLARKTKKLEADLFQVRA